MEMLRTSCRHIHWSWENIVIITYYLQVDPGGGGERVGL